MEAAFFDLDKTVISRSSVFAVGMPIYREGLLSKRLLFTGIYRQILYSLFGADEDTMERAREDLLRITRGWDRAEIERIVGEALEVVIGPIVYAEAIEAIRSHKAQGRKVLIVSSSPEEIVAPLGRFIGVDGVIATRAEIVDGIYTGRLEFYCYSDSKAEQIRRFASLEEIDLSRSYAYSDSITDLPMLEVVGNPVVVNGDRRLRQAAAERGWESVRWRRRMMMRRRIPTPPPRAAIGIGVTTALSTAAAVGVWWLRQIDGEGVSNFERTLVGLHLIPPRPTPGRARAAAQRLRTAARITGSLAAR